MGRNHKVFMQNNYCNAYGYQYVMVKLEFS